MLAQALSHAAGMSPTTAGRNAEGMQYNNAECMCHHIGLSTGLIALW